jgi:hypothetical protein
MALFGDGERPHACTCRPPSLAPPVRLAFMSSTAPILRPLLFFCGLQRFNSSLQLISSIFFALIISFNIYWLRVSCVVSPPLSKPCCLGARCRDSDVFALSFFVLSPHGSYLSCLAGSKFSLSLSLSLSLSHTHTHTHTHTHILSFIFFAVGSLLLIAFVSVPGAQTSMLPSHLCCRCVVATIVISS